MRVVIQRSKEASVEVDGKIVGKINKGFVLLVGFGKDDTKDVVNKVCEKVINLRIFEDDGDKMNLSLKDVNGEILSVSQFTLYACLKGRRPSFTDALGYNEASSLYEYFNDTLKSYNVNVQTGVFGGDMKVSLINDGPVTITIDSEKDF